MANLQALAVEFGAAFPFGVGMVGEVQEQNDFDRSTREHPVQARDKDTGLPVWLIEVIDFDPQARTKTYRVKVIAEVRPVPPEALADAPIRPVVLQGPDGHALHRGGLAAEDRLQLEVHRSAGAGSSVGRAGQGGLRWGAHR